MGLSQKKWQPAPNLFRSKKKERAPSEKSDASSKRKRNSTVRRSSKRWLLDKTEDALLVIAIWVNQCVIVLAVAVNRLLRAAGWCYEAREGIAWPGKGEA